MNGKVSTKNTWKRKRFLQPFRWWIIYQQALLRFCPRQFFADRVCKVTGTQNHHPTSMSSFTSVSEQGPAGDATDESGPGEAPSEADNHHLQHHHQKQVRPFLLPYEVAAVVLLTCPSGISITGMFFVLGLSHGLPEVFLIGMITMPLRCTCDRWKVGRSRIVD